MVKISASQHFPRLLGRTPNAFQIPPRPLDWRTGTSHSSRIDSPPPLCLPVLPNEDKWVHSPPIPGITLYLTVVPYKAGRGDTGKEMNFSTTARKSYCCPIDLLHWSCQTAGSVVEIGIERFREGRQKVSQREFM